MSDPPNRGLVRKSFSDLTLAAAPGSPRVHIASVYPFTRCGRQMSLGDCWQGAIGEVTCRRCLRATVL